MIAPSRLALIDDPPFAHVIAHRHQWYAYDVNTNEYLVTDAVLGRTLAALTGERPARDIGRLIFDLGGEAVGAALAEIETARRDEGLFLSHRPRTTSRRLTRVDPAPYASRLSHLILTVTEDCNLVCRYCPQAADRLKPGSSRPRHMSRETALKGLAYFAEHCGDAEHPTVSFYGGEPLLRPDLMRDVVSYARSRRDWPELRFVIDTNGTLIGDAVAEWIAREGLFLQVSLDGPRAAHDRWRCFPEGRGSHGAVLDGLRRVLRVDPGSAQRIVFQVTAGPPVDLHSLADWFGTFGPYRDLGLRQQPRLRFDLADLWWDSEASAPDQGDILRQIAEARVRWLAACASGRRGELDPITRQLFDGDMIRFYHRSRERLSEVFVPGGCCQLGVRRLTVSPDGRLGACERGRIGLEIGHVDTGIDVGRVAKLTAAYSRALGGRCGGCWAVRLCSLCPATLTRRDGSGAIVISEQDCLASRQRTAFMLRGYAELMAAGVAAGRFLLESRVS